MNTLKEQAFEDIVTYIEGRKHQLLAEKFVGLRPDEVSDAMMVELMLVERIYLKKFAEYNKTLSRQNQKNEDMDIIQVAIEQVKKSNYKPKVVWYMKDGGIPSWIIEYNNCGFESSAGKAIKILIDHIKMLEAENEKLTRSISRQEFIDNDEEEKV